MELFKGKRVVVMGLGLNNGGVGVAKFFCKQGADVLVTDLKTKEELEKSLFALKKCRIDYRLGEHREEDFKNADMVIKNPAVPETSYYLKVAKENSVEIESDVNLFFKLCKAQIIGVTGTKGKSTVSSLIFHILKTQNKNTFLAGNIGVTPLEILNKINPKSKVVLELSSFELEDLGKSPDVAVIVSIYPDHLNRYGTMEKYIEAKKRIFKFQKPGDILILNADDYIVRQFANEAVSNVQFFSKGLEKTNSGCYVRDKTVYFEGEKEPVCDISDFMLAGAHNISNYLAAITTAKILGVPKKTIRRSVRTFKGISNRQELVAEKRGVKYINDTTATIPVAAIEGLRATGQRFPNSRIILIAGGQDKNVEYLDFAKEIAKSVCRVVLLPGTATDKIKECLASIKTIEIVLADSMEQAVNAAASKAEKGDVVLLSPAATSFNLFKNEFDRGEQFNKFVKKL